MHEGTLEDVQKIKELLSANGQDVDETVICELLESFDPQYGVDTAEYIFNMIMDDGEDNFQDTSNVASSSVTEIAPMMRRDTSKVPNSDVHTNSMKLSHAETIDISSDPDDDRDFYYQSTDFDDISILDIDKTDAVLVPSRCNISLNQVMPDSSNSEVVVANNNIQDTKVESLEENNNNVYKKSVSYDRHRFSESPKPGCSKDSDNIYQEPEKFCHFCNSDELQEDAKRIHALLPAFNYDFIYRILCNNQLTTNRIELTLWDLLPKERPKAQPLRKRKSLDDICSRKCKRNLNTCSRKDPVSTETFSKKKHQMKNKMKVKDIELKIKELISITNSIDRIEKDNVPKTIAEDEIEVAAVKLICKEPMLLKTDQMEKRDIDQSADSIKAKLKRLEAANDTEVFIYEGESSVSDLSKPSSSNTELHLTNNSVIPRKMEATSSEDITPVQHNLLRPPRFNPDTNTCVVPFVRPTPILAPAKLKNICKNLPSTQVLDTTVTYNGKSIHVKCQTKINELSENKTNANVAQSSGILAITNSQNKTLSNVEAKLATNSESPVRVVPMPNMSQSAKQDTLPIYVDMIRPHNIELPETIVGEHQQEKDIINKTQYNSVCDTGKETKDCRSLNDMEAKPSKEEEKNIPNNSREEIILSAKTRNIYYKLIPMFPTIKTDYIKRLCQTYDKEDVVFNETALLQTLVEHLLNCDQEHPFIKQTVKQLPLQQHTKTYDVNEQYADLLGIFPEADPVYLRDIAEQMYNDPEQIKQFVQSKLENPDYPTRAQYLAKKKITEQQKQYTTDFQVEQFLQIFPDPFSHFEDSKRQCQFHPHAVDFLKHYFCKLRVNTLLTAYSQYEHNLSLTAKNLRTLNYDMKTKRCTSKIILTLIEDIPLLQECAFIAHNTELRKYLDDLKVKEEIEFQELKAKGGLFECQCCYDDECMPSKCSTCEDGHIFCNSCIIKSTDITLAEGKTHIYCLLNCGTEFPLFMLQRILPPTKFSILLCKRQEAEIMAAGVEGLVSCPFCHFASIPPPEDKVFKCLNPDCMKESCRLCKEINHIPMKCNEVKSDAARLLLEEKMTEALVRKCYRCGRTFYKEEGCNKMTCVCGAQMCYICDKPVTNYQHFQGQGVARSNLCPLWTDDRVMNAETVITVCNETMKHIKEKNPDVSINVNALLPKLPPRSKGPHEDTAYANIIPERANRIAKQIP